MRTIIAATFSVLITLCAATPTDAGQTDETPQNQATAELIAKRRVEVFERPPGSEERRRRIERLIELRRQLIEQHPFDLQLPVWKADQAFDLLFLALPENANIPEVEFGLPSLESRAKLVEITDRAWTLAEDAAIGIADTILEIEESPDFHDDVRLQQQRRHLMQFEQRERVPFLVATAGYYRAVAQRPEPRWPSARAESDDTNNADTDSPEAMQLFNDVIDSSMDLDLLLDEPWRTQIRSIKAVSHLALGEVDSARRIIEEIDDRSSLERAVRFRLHMTQQMINEASASSSTVEAILSRRAEALRSIPGWVRDDPLLLLVQCDHELTMRLGLLARHPLFRTDDRSQARSRAFRDETTQNEWLLAAYDPFLESEIQSPAHSAREQLVGEHVARVIPSSVPADRLPPLVVIAQAASQLRDEEMHDQGVEALRFLLGRQNLAEWVHPRARYLLATDSLRAGRVLDAANELLRIERDWPESTEARPAIEQAIIAAIEALQNDADLDDDVEQALTGVLDDAIQLLAERFNASPNFARLMFHHGRLELDRARYSAAMESFRAVPPDSPIYLEAKLELVRACHEFAQHLETGGAAVIAEKHRVLREMISTAEAVITRLGTSADDVQSSDDQDRLTTLRIMIADAYLRLEEPKSAIASLENISADELADQSVYGQVLRIRVEALRALGRSDEAEDELRELAERNATLALPVLDRIVNSIYDEAVRLEQSNAAFEALKDAADRLLPLAELALSIVRSERQQRDEPHREEMERRIRFHIAEAHRLAGNFAEAKRRLAGLRAEHPESASILTSYAECLYQTGEDVDALNAYSEVSTSLVGERNWMFWQAELRILQILDRNGRNTERIFPRIQRLRQYDRNLGGQRFEKAFQKLELRHAP